MSRSRNLRATECDGIVCVETLRGHATRRRGGGKGGGGGDASPSAARRAKRATRAALRLAGDWAKQRCVEGVGVGGGGEGGSLPGGVDRVSALEVRRDLERRLVPAPVVERVVVEVLEDRPGGGAGGGDRVRIA
eukprot:gene14115-biopygen589